MTPGFQTAMEHIIILWHCYFGDGTSASKQKFSSLAKGVKTLVGYSGDFDIVIVILVIGLQPVSNNFHL